MPSPDTDHLIRELHAVLAACQNLIAEHQAIPDQYRDTDGHVIEDTYAAYDDARITTAIEASDHLDTVIEHLARLVGQYRTDQLRARHPAPCGSFPSAPPSSAPAH